MQLALSVLTVVLAFTIALAVCGYLIDRSAARHERNEGR